MINSDETKRNPILVEARVRCSGHIHRITLRSNGALVLEDHQDTLRDELAIAASGGGRSRCLHVLKAWRDYNIKFLPPALRPAMEAAIKLREERALRRNSRIDRLALPSRDERIKALLAPLVAHYADRSSYRRAAPDLRKLRVLVVSDDPQVGGFSWQTGLKGSKYPVTGSCLWIRVTPSWYARVYRRGIALINGCFVADVIDERPNGDLVVLAGRQGRGFEVRTRRARVVQGKIRWLE